MYEYINLIHIVYYIVYDIVYDIVYGIVSDAVLAVGCLNNDRSVLSKSCAWILLILLPILKGFASSETNEDWIRHRRIDSELYHAPMEHYC